VGVILGQQLAVQADSVLETIDGSLSTVTGSLMNIREQEAAGVCYFCATHRHTSVNCPRLKSGNLQSRQNTWASGINPLSTCRTFQDCMRSGKNQSLILELQASNRLELASGVVIRQGRHRSSITRKLLKPSATQMARQQVGWRGGC
jgi:hypothetical protein